MIDRDFFFAAVRDSLFEGSMDRAEVDGCNMILDAWEKLAPNADLRWIAYSLATAYLETAYTMQPIREIGEGRSHAYPGGYGEPAGPDGQVYYGRGLVQLTWLRNYQHATSVLKAHDVLGPNDDLVKDPDLALRMDVACAVLVFGMTGGWFTSRKLSDFFAPTTSNWIDAREIINGHDRAEEIAGYAKLFDAALLPPTKEAA